MRFMKCVAALFQADIHFREIHFFMWFFEFQKIDLPSTKKIQKNDRSHEKSSFFEFPLHVLERIIFWKSKNHKWGITFSGNAVLHLCFSIWLSRNRSSPNRAKKPPFFPVVEGFKIVRSRGIKQSNNYSNPFCSIFIFFIVVLKIYIGMDHFYYRKYLCMSCVNCETFKTDPFTEKSNVCKKRKQSLGKGCFQGEKNERLKRLVIWTFLIWKWLKLDCLLPLDLTIWILPLL